ncbi:MAG: PLP-dependent aminotransferase family protein [Thermoproteota archaeon]|jgi:2-aminoadipate transaminase|nr:PLP-dependent aminotransferase family protein [Thermoproteota archaeon]
MQYYKRFLAKRANLIEPSPLAKILSKIEEYRKKGKRIISLAAGDPDPNVIPREEISKIAQKILVKNPASVLYTPTAGIEELRKHLADFISKYDGFKVKAEEIIVTSGSTMAIDLFSRIILDPGDIVIVENPSYINSILAFKQHGAKLIGIDLDEDGLSTHKLEEEIKNLGQEIKKIKFIYIIPTGQNPAGITMSLEKRKHLLEIASKYEILILEDLAYNYLIFEGNPLPPLKSMDKEGRVIVAGTLSKIMGTGFRIGWLIAEKEIRELVLNEKQPIDFNAPTISQYIALEFLKMNLFVSAIEKSRTAYMEKRNALLKILSEASLNFKYTKPIAGIFLILDLMKVNAEEFANRLLEEKHVAVIPAKPFFVKGGETTIRINFSRPSIQEIEEGVKAIVSLYRTY